MNNEYNNLLQIVSQISEITDIKPKIALVLGSGLGDFIDNIEVIATVPYDILRHFPVSTVEGHEGQFIFGYIGVVPIVAMQGRVHLYEGYTPSQVVMPIRVMSMLGAEILFLTNAAGGISYNAGSLMMITGQISSFVPSPLIGENIEELGTRFPDMSEIYDTQLQKTILDTASQLDINLDKGVYIQFSGPNYESPEEIRMSKVLGADAVGMSTAIEAIAGVHMGMRICGISCITNSAAGISQIKLSHEEVGRVAKQVSSTFAKLVRQSIENMEG